MNAEYLPANNTAQLTIGDMVPCRLCNGRGEVLMPLASNGRTSWSNGLECGFCDGEGYFEKWEVE